MTWNLDRITFAFKDSQTLIVQYLFSRSRYHSFAKALDRQITTFRIA